MFTLEFLPRGRFRIVAPDGKTKGETASFQHIATLELDGKTWIAVSSYYGGTSGLPVETVLPLGKTTISTKVVDHTVPGEEGD